MNSPLPALLRTDLRYFVWKVFSTVLPGTTYLPNWHIDAIVHQLMRIDSGENRRLLINQPPRSLKSICVSIAYPAWLLGRDPTKHIIVVSYSHDFASELHRQFRTVVDASWYQTLYPGMRPAKDSGTELVTTAGGGRYATAAMTGQANDYSVCTTWKKCKKDYFLIDVFRARLQYPDLRRMVASLASRHAADTVLIEDAGPGMMLLQDLQREIPTGMNRPIGVKPEGSKADRMVAQSAKIEAGHVYLPRKAEWLDSFLLEVLGFPQATHDDQIDSVSQFLKWASTQALYDDTDLGFVSVGFNPVQNW